MTLNEGMLYGKRQSFVFLRYVAVFFFFLSLIASYYIIDNALTQAVYLLDSIDTLSIPGVLAALTSFKLSGQFGVFIQALKNLGAVVIPLYFVATVTFVLNLNRGKMGQTIVRVTFLAFLMFIAEFLILSFVIGLINLLISEFFSSVAANYSDTLDAINQILAALGISPDSLSVGDTAAMFAEAESLVTQKLTVALLKNFPSINIFLDQLLCLLMCLFFCTKPKRANTKLKLGLFRSLGLLPIAYVIATFVLNGLTRSGVIFPKIIVLCLFPSKALPHYIFIAGIIAAFRRHERRQLPYEGRPKFSPDGKKWYRPTTLIYETVEQASTRTLDTATYLSIWLLVLAGVDFLLGSMPIASDWGFGKSYYAIFAIPFLFFFDANKPVRKTEYNAFSLTYILIIFLVVIIYLYV